MAAYELLLLNTSIPQIQAAQSGDTYVVPRDIAFSAALTLSAGTANGVPYLNGSKVVTTGSALTFDGTNLSIGGAGASKKLQISGATGVGLRVQDAAYVYKSGDITYESAGLTILSGDNLIFGASSTEGMRLTSTGLELKTGNLIIGTAGKGIDFSVTSSGTGTMTSELLDDYEEGTFTPIVTDGTNNANTYYYQFANYTKIGNRVFFNITISINDKGSITGDIWVKGLPFTSSSSGFPDNLTWFATACKIFNTGARDEMAAQVEPNNTIVTLWQVTGNGQASVTGAQVTGGSQIFLCGHYFTAS